MHTLKHLHVWSPNGTTYKVNCCCHGMLLFATWVCDPSIRKCMRIFWNGLRATLQSTSALAFWHTDFAQSWFTVMHDTLDVGHASTMIFERLMLTHDNLCKLVSWFPWLWRRASLCNWTHRKCKGWDGLRTCRILPPIARRFSAAPPRTKSRSWRTIWTANQFVDGGFRCGHRLGKVSWMEWIHWSNAFVSFIGRFALQLLRLFMQGLLYALDRFAGNSFQHMMTRVTAMFVKEGMHTSLASKFHEGFVRMH